MTNRKKQKAFSLIELLLVMVILATLAAIVVPKFTGRSKEAKITAAKAQIGNFETALDAFEVDNGFYPEGDTGLQALVEEPSDAKNWHGPYLKKGIPNDPWGNPYNYEYPGKNNEEGYDISSNGPDGKKGTEDDIDNWTTE
ncbi:MAG: type II secretion system major pseudopilin GspG [bacterium]